MSDVTNDEIREILDNIRARTDKSDIDDETVRKWSREDIDRLLAVTRRESAEEVEKTEETAAEEEESIYVAEKSFEALSEEEAEQEEVQTDEKNNIVVSVLENIKGGFAKFSAKFKTSAKKVSESINAVSEDDADFDNDEEDYDDDSDMKIVGSSDEKKPEYVQPDVEEKTRHIEKTELENAVAEPVKSAEPIPETQKSNDEADSEQDDEQMMLDGYEDTADEAPDKIEESEAERELFEKRKKKIDTFVLFGEDSDPYDSDGEKEKIGELFDTHDDRPIHKETEKFEGLEYDRAKDARRVQKYLISQKKKSRRKVLILCGLLILAAVTGVVSSAVTTVAGDRILTILINIIISVSSLAVASQSILESFELLKKKKFNINTIISASAIICFVQTVMMFVLYFFNRNSVSVFGGTGVALLLIGELNSYIVNCRTADAMELCSGENKDKLYSIESISDDKDVIELSKNIRSGGARIRYSCKTKFPSHLVEMCMSETSADSRSRLLLLVLGIMGIINLAVAWAISGRFAVGFAALTITLALSVPAYGALLTQLPLRWINKRINRTGAMLSCQDAVNELYRTNAVVLDSRDLFDKNACSLAGFRDFKNVRMDDAMLYAAAMVIRSGGPLTGVFDKMVVGRRDVLPTVKSFSYEEKLGISGWIYNQKVILGNRMLMENHNIDVSSGIDEDKYLMQGHEILYLAIAHKLAAMFVVDYAPNKKLAPYLKKLRDSGVSILVRNCDPNVTERMISECYDMRLDNIKIINSASGRVFKKYKSRPKITTRAVAIHDGSTYTFLKTLCTCAMLRHTFKITNALTLIGMGMGFAVVLVLSILNVVADLPAIFVILLQTVIAGAFVGVTRISCGK